MRGSCAGVSQFDRQRGFGLTELSHLNLTILLCLIHVGSEHFAPYTN